METNMKAIVVYHNKDMDGFCSGAIARLEFERQGIEAEMFGWDYNDPLPDSFFFEGKDVILTDISFPADLMKNIRTVANSFHWFDHHISAIRDSEAYGYDDVYGIRKVGDSATKIIYEHYVGRVLPQVAYWVDRYDVWKQGSDWQTVMINQYGMRALLPDPAEDINTWKKALAGKLTERIADKGFTLYDFIKQENYKVAKRSFDLEFEGLKFLALNWQGGSTVLESRITPEYDGMLMFYYTGKEWSVSLYGNGKDIDLSLIAKKFAGGGHRDSCGFKLDQMDFNIFILDKLLKTKY